MVESTPQILIELQEGAQIPSYQTAGAAGMDLHANNSSPITLHPGQRAAIPTGLRMTIPQGYEGQVRPRSGLALKHGVTVINSPGTIDADFRGEVKILLINLGSQPFIVEKGDRIAQLIVSPCVRAEISVVSEMPATERGESGFGSTGV